MSQAILVLNAGSSSLKFSLYEIVGAKLNMVARGLLEGLGTAPRFKAKDEQGGVLADRGLQSSSKQFGHPEAFAQLAQWLREHYADDYELVGVGHRVVHGGSKFTQPVRIDGAIIRELEALAPLAPLHQPHNLAAIKSVMATSPQLPQVACFDTAFHQGRHALTQRFGLPDELFQQGIRRWGFHGLSYESITRKVQEIAAALQSARLIVAHLGSGASLCAIRDGRSVDTTMSFSVLDGLPMGTRCGSLDPGVILYLLQQGKTAGEIEQMLYSKSGLLGISGVSNDVRDLQKSSAPRAAEAMEFFSYRIAREIGSLVTALGGLDALIFTAGIGENSALIRQRVCDRLAWLGITLDAESNQQHDQCISLQGQSPSVWVIPTDEEGVIASHTLNVIQSRPR